MAMFSADAEDVLGPDFLRRLSASDLLPGQRAVIDDGWVLDRGAALLVALRGSYFGQRSRFPEPVDYELAVNGRGAPDLHIEEQGRQRARRLMREGTAFAWEALHAANTLMPGYSLTARVSASPIVDEPDRFTGYVSFFSTRYVEEAWLRGVVGREGVRVFLTSDDCVEPLPE